MAGAALSAALGPTLIVLIVSSIVLGGFGVPVPMLGVWLLDSSTFRVVILLGWALLFLPAAKATLAVSGARYLMQFPSGLGLRMGLSIFVLVLMTSPIAVLLIVGGGLQASALAVSWIVALQIIVASPPYPWLERALQLATVVGLLLLLRFGSQPWMSLVPLLPASIGIAGSIRRSDDGSKRSFRRVLVGGVFCSLTLAHLCRIWRRERAMAVRIAIALGFGLVTMRTGWAANSHQGLEESLRISLAIQTPGLAVIAIMMALSGRSSLHELRWLLASLHISPKYAMATSWAASIATCSIVTLAISIASISELDSSDAVLIVTAFWIHGLALSCAAQWLSFGPWSGTGAESSRPAVLMAGLASVLCVAVGIAGHWVLLIEILLVPAAWIYGQMRSELYA